MGRTYVMKNDINELLKHLSYEQKKELLNFLFALGKQEKQDIQEPASVSPAIGD